METDKSNAKAPARRQPLDMALPVGTVLHGEHDYCVEEVLGQGGFGFTYRVSAMVQVNNIKASLQFAIKEHFVKGHCMRDPNDKVSVVYAEVARAEVIESREDFVHEAKRLVSICKTNQTGDSNHNIVPVNECFEANGTAYFVMEYLSGGSLRSLVRRHGALSETAALSYMKPIIDAVEFLHTQHRLLHMDIKPENIVMRTAKDGAPEVPMLIDFGISLHFKNDGSLTTRSNPGFATPGYSPLEQSGAIREFEPRFDVYGLGATLFYLLAGHDPLPAADMDETYINAELPAGVSPRTRAAIVHALQPLKRDRTATAKDLLLELEADYTLPIGHLLESGRARYRVTRIIDDHGHYLEYEAHYIPSDTARRGGAVEAPFRVFELFAKDISRRLDDYAVGQGDKVDPADFEAAVRDLAADEVDTQLADTVLYDEYGEIQVDMFQRSGTRYCAVRAGYKPKSKIVSAIANVGTTTRRGVGRLWQLVADNMVMLGVALCTCAVIAAGVALAPRVMSALDNKETSGEAPVEQSQPPQPAEPASVPEADAQPATEEQPAVEPSREVVPAEPERPQPAKTEAPAQSAKPEAPKSSAKPEAPTPAAKPEAPKPAAVTGNADQAALQLLARLSSAGTPPSMADMDRLNALAAKAGPDVKAKVKAFNKKWDY